MIKYGRFTKSDLDIFFDRCKLDRRIVFVDLVDLNRGDYFRSLGLAYIPTNKGYRTSESKYVASKVSTTNYQTYVIGSTVDLDVETHSKEILSIEKCIRRLLSSDKDYLLMTSVDLSDVFPDASFCEYFEHVPLGITRNIIIADARLFHKSVVHKNGKVINPLNVILDDKNNLSDKVK